MNNLVHKIIENETFYFTIIIIIPSLHNYLWLMHNLVPRLSLLCLPWTTTRGRGESLGTRLADA